MKFKKFILIFLCSVLIIIIVFLLSFFITKKYLDNLSKNKNSIYFVEYPINYIKNISNNRNLEILLTSIDNDDNNNFTESEIMEVLYNMSLSKITISDNNIQPIEINKKRIISIKKIIFNSKYIKKKELLIIINNWARNDFSDIINEYKFLCKYLGIKIDKAAKIKK